MACDMQPNLVLMGHRPGVLYGALFAPPARTRRAPAWCAGEDRPTWLGRIATRFEAFRKRHATIGELAGLSDAQLRDIGITRAELATAAQQDASAAAMNQLSRCRDMHIATMR